MKNGKLFILPIFIISSLLLLGAGCQSKSESITEARNLCEINEGQIPEAPPTDIDNQNQLYSPVLILYKNSYKRLSKWNEKVELSSGSNGIHSNVEPNTVICISESRYSVATYQSGSHAYQIRWTVQLISYPEGKLTAYNSFQDDEFTPPKFKGGVSDLYSDPPDERLVSDWILSNLQVKPDIFNGINIRDFALSQEGSHLAIIRQGFDEDQFTIEVWDVTTKLLIHRFDVSEVGKVAISPDDKLLAVASMNAALLFDLETFEEVSSIEDISDKEITSLNFSPDSMYLAAGFEGGSVQIWDINSRQIMFSFQGEEQNCSGNSVVLFFPDGEKLAAASEGCFRVWDLESGQNILTDLQRYDFKYGETIDIAISSDGAYLAFAKREGEIVILSTDTWETLKYYNDKTNFGEKLPSYIAFLPDSNILAGNIHDKLMFWDVETFERLGNVKLISLKLMAFPDGKSLAVWGDDGIQFINIETYIDE